MVTLTKKFKKSIFLILFFIAIANSATATPNNTFVFTNEKIDKLYRALSKSPIHTYTCINFFHKELDPETNNAVYVEGDLDGNIIRLIYAAFMSGHIELTEEGFELFINLIETETEVFMKQKTMNERFIACQSSPELYEKINNLMKHIKYTTSLYGLVCIGDIMFDRFTNNILAMTEIVIKLSNCGVIFIKGNHDFIDTLDHFPSRDIKYAASRGFYSRDIESIKTDKLLRKKIITAIDKFVLAHYDAKLKIFFTHAALAEQKIDDKDFIFYCGKNYTPINIDLETLCKKICKSYTLISDDMTSWRPKWDSKLKLPNILLIHGHDGNADERIKKDICFQRNELDGVFCINSKLDEHFAAILILFLN